MDLDDDTAQDVLDNAIEVSGKKQLIAVDNRRSYVFQYEKEGVYHGYPVSGAELL